MPHHREERGDGYTESALSRLAWSLAVGTVSAVVASVVAWTILLGLSGWNWRVAARGLTSATLFGGLVRAAPVGAFLAGCSLWFVFVERPGAAGTVRGAIVGGVIAVASHPLMWTVSESVRILGKETVWTGGLTNVALLPLFVIMSGLSASALSLLLVGWLTVPAGAVAGAGLGGLRNRSIDRARSRDGERGGGGSRNGDRDRG